MSNDAALEKWIEDDMRDVPCAMPVDEAGEYMCRAAWYAAVKHTLAHVAAKFIDQAGDATTREARFVREWGNLILNMKP